MSDYIHLLAAAAWLGGLLLLPVLIGQIYRAEDVAQRGEIPQLLRRFSYMASFAVFLLTLTGLFNSLVELPDLASLLNTPYGQVLLAKLALVAFALEIAFFNNRLVHRQVQRLEQATVLRRFHRQVTLEAAITLGIMLSVAVLVQTPGPRRVTTSTAAFQPDLPFNTITRAGDLYIHVQVTPNHVGNNRFWAHLYHQDGSEVGEVQLTRLLFTYQVAELGQAQLDLEPLGQDTFAVEGANLSQTGLWDLSLYVRRRGMDDVLGEFSLMVPPPQAGGGSPSPWQSPIPGIPPWLLTAAVLVALGAIPFLWHAPLRAAYGRRYPILAWVGGPLVLLGLAIAVILAPRLLAGPDAGGAPPPANPGSIAHGAQLFQEKCAVCHGSEGLGNGPLAATMELPPANMYLHIPLHEDRAIFGFISQGFPGTAMPAFKEQLSAEEIWHVINYLRYEFGGGRAKR